MNAYNNFFTAWGEADQAKQAEVVAAAVTADMRYADPMTDAPLTGPDAVAGYISQFIQMVPGASATVVDCCERDGIARITVEFRMPDGAAKPGQYFGQTDDTGRITRLVGYAGLGVPV